MTVTVLTLFALAVASSLALTPVTLCVVLRTGRVPQAGHALYSAAYYANEYPNLQVNWKVIGIWEPSGTTTRGCVRAFAANGTDCDILIGPGSSGIAQAMNPLVNSMWLDYSATATTLSDRVEYALFSRVVPTDSDATAGMGYLMNELRWNAVYLVCADNAYGQSVVAGVSQSVNAVGGFIVSADCTLPSASYAVVEAKVLQAMASSTRIIFAAMATTDPIFPLFIKAVIAQQAYVSHTILFSESACSSTPFAWSQVPGSFCATFAVDRTLFDPFFASYKATDKSNYASAFAALGWPASAIDLTSTSTYPALAADATRLALAAYSSWIARNGTASTAANMIAWLRKQSLTGFSGYITLPTGNRAVANMVVYNAAVLGSTNATTVIIAANTTATGNVSLASQIYCFNKLRSRAEIPPAQDPVSASSDGSTNVVIGVVAGAVVLLILVVGGGLAARGSGGKDNRYAPKDPHKEFTIIFTDIQSSTAQWARNAEVMGPAVDQHHALIRTVIKKYHGYEVKTIGDSFMVAFEKATDALKCSMAIQEVLYTANWPAGIDELYMEKEKEAQFTSYAEGTTYHDVWSGLRVRVGMHTGSGDIKFDAVALSYDYYGTVVNTAARVEGVGNGGQVLLTDSAISAVQMDDEGKAFLNSLIATYLGPQPLRGLQGPVALTQLLSPEFEARRYQALRLDQEPANLEENTDDDESATGTTGTTDNNSMASQSMFLGPKLPNVPKDTPEYEVKRASRRLARSGVTAAALMDLYNFLRAAVSTIPAQQRKKLVYDIAEKWRIPEAKKKGTADHEKDANFMLVRLATKAAPVAASFKNPFNLAGQSGRALGESSRLLGDATAAISKSGAAWSEGNTTPRDASMSPHANSLLIPIPGAVVPIPTQGEETA